MVIKHNFIVQKTIMDLFKNGITEIEMNSLKQMKEPTYFWLSEYGDGIKVNKLKHDTLKWEEFEEIVKVANKLGGKIYRGDVIAQDGDKVGNRIKEDCIEGVVAYMRNIENGKSITRRSTYFSGVLEKAGIATVHRSDGQGSFIAINEKYRNIK